MHFSACGVCPASDLARNPGEKCNAAYCKLVILWIWRAGLSFDADRLFLLKLPVCLPDRQISPAEEVHTSDRGDRESGYPGGV